MPQVCEEDTGLVVVHPLQDFNHRPHEPQSWEQTLNMSENLERSHTSLFFSEAKKLKVPDQYETHSDDWWYMIYMRCYVIVKHETGWWCWKSQHVTKLSLFFFKMTPITVLHEAESV